MAETVAYCGINCRKCPVYRMTRFADRTGRRGLAQWLLRPGSKWKLAPDSWCDGCTAIDARTVPGCRDCVVRCCAMERGVVTCAECERFGCDRLQQVWSRTVFRDAEPRLRRRHERLRGSRAAGG